MCKKVFYSLFLVFLVGAMSAHADELISMPDATIEDGELISFRFQGKEYIPANGDVVLGTTSRWYVSGGVETLWEEGGPTPAATVTGTSTPKPNDVASNADDFFFGPAGSEDGMSSIDGIDFQETIFENTSTLFFAFEQGGNDNGSWRAIYADGSMGPAVAFTSGSVYGSTGVTIGSQVAHGVAFRTDAPAIGVRITASGHDTYCICIPKPIPFFAVSPNPASGATDVSRDTKLSWVPGIFADTHDVYFGMDEVDVNDASRTDQRGVLVSEGQTGLEFDPGRLEFGQTYFWRIDEVNAPSSPATYKGAVWNFTVEPRAFAVTPVEATASSSFMPTMGAENTINGSGLNADDQHGTTGTDMWLTKNTDTERWIQYKFDKLQKLHEMWVWNSNQAVEGFVGFGVKDVTIETSTDAITWTALSDVPEFVQAPGADGYTHNTVVDFQGVTAQYVRLSVNSGWGFLPMPQFGLSEVRFYAIPVYARLPEPSVGASGLPVEVVLNWRGGRDAAEHEVYVGMDPNALDFVGKTSDSSLVVAATLGQANYWRVDAVNNAEDPAVWPGDVWDFSTAAYLVIDDMEAYEDAEFMEIWATWVDGYEDNSNGSLVGNGSAPETEVVHGGSKSLPMHYDNSSSPLSETTRTFDQPLDWNQGGVKTLSIWFSGASDNTGGGQLYAKINGTRVDYDGDAGNLTKTTWQPFNVALSDFGGVNLGAVRTLTVGIAGGSAKGTLYVDDIRLYPTERQQITPEVPSADALVTQLTFDSGLGGTGLGGVQTTSDPQMGSVLFLDGIDDAVDLGPSDAYNPVGSFSVAAWINVELWVDNWGNIIISKRGEQNVGWQLRRHSGNSNLVFTVRGTTGGDDPRGNAVIQTGEWYHAAGVYDMDAGKRTLYVNGMVDRQIDDTGTVAPATHNVYVGCRATQDNSGQERFFSGMIDDARYYNRALSQGEIGSLAGISGDYDIGL